MSAQVGAAEPPGDEAKARVRKATGEYNLGQYLQAARDYEAAYLETLDANLLFNVGQAYRLAGETDKAITAYRSYLRSNPPSDRRVLAESKLRELEEKRASAPVPPSMPTTPAVAPTPVMPPSPPAPVPPSTTPNESFRAVAAPPGEPNALVTEPVSEPPKSSPFYTRWPFWVLTGVVVAGGVVVAVLLVPRGGSKLDMGNPTIGTKEF
jgi:tetratricopeptide (TPR) repeat protein